VHNSFGESELLCFQTFDCCFDSGSFCLIQDSKKWL